MAIEYSIEACEKLREKFNALELYRPGRIERYDAGRELVYDVESVGGNGKGRVHLVVEKFVGGGFAGQVYKVKVNKLEAENERLGGLEVGGVYAMKILVPPTSFSRIFRSVLYRVGFQGPFQLQVNPAAARAGALWQKFIRQAAGIRFGDKNAVVDIHAMFVDEKLGSCGELSEWVEGRTWRLEVDEYMDALRRWGKDKKVNEALLGSPEYRAKKEFMAEFVKLLHEMGGCEFARQYEWWTCKSQPNCLKRSDTEDNPSAGLVAVDFRAGLALLPFLPMSPGDFKLILKGLIRGALVQFDRGNIEKLEQFIESHSEEFSDMRPMLDELKTAEQIYRNSVPDITHNHIKLLYSRQLWSTMLSSAVTSWKVRGLIETRWEQKFRNNRFLTVIFLLLGCIPILGMVLRKSWGRSDWRRHYFSLLTSRGYFKRAVSGKIIEKVIGWYRAGRIDQARAFKISQGFGGFLCHLPFSILPVGLHRFLTDRDFRREKLVYIFVRPVRLYFNAHLREQWLREMVAEGRSKHILTDEDAEVILSQIDEPYIQKYLISLVVHLLTLPVTQIVSVTIAAIYWFTHWGQPNAFGIGLGIIAAFQVTPISPGSLARGFYTLGLAIKEKDFKDYNIAVFLSFFKYIGYLAFPIQMTYHYPALARFMAGHWATEAVHIVPVFGERGAVLEHWVFCLFYNWPLTIRRRMKERTELRTALKPRYRHVGSVVILAAIIFGLADFIYFGKTQMLPNLRDIWWLSTILPLGCGMVVTLGCGGASRARRFIAATICGILTGALYTGISAIISGQIAGNCAWRVFVFALLSVIGAVLTELKLPGKNLT